MQKKERGLRACKQFFKHLNAPRYHLVLKLRFPGFLISTQTCERSLGHLNTLLSLSDCSKILPACLLNWFSGSSCS